MSICENCEHSQDYGESTTHIQCERLKRKKEVPKTDTCEYFQQYIKIKRPDPKNIFNN